MSLPERKMGRPTKDGPKVEGAGIALYPAEKQALDELAKRFGVRSRGDVVRRLLADHPEAQQVLTNQHSVTATA